MDVEKTFGISLPDARLPKMTTVGEVHDCIVEILNREEEEIGLRNTVFERLQEDLQLMPGTVVDQVNEDMLLGEMIPVRGRRRVWKKLQKSLDIPFPALHRPRSLKIIVAITAAVLSAATIWGMFGIWQPSQMLALAKVQGFWVMFFIVAGFWGLVGCWLTKPAAVVWPTNLRTVGDLTRTLATTKFGAVTKHEREWNREEVWSILQGIVARDLGVDVREVTREARLVEDLGAG